MRYNIIQTENYLIIVDDSEIKEGDWCLANGATYNNTIVKYLKSPCPPPYVSNLSILKKIIAHLPLNNSPILDGVDLLPPLEDDVCKIAINEVGVDGEIYNEYDCETFIKGYNKAKEKYKWTDEDLMKVIELTRSLYLEDSLKANMLKIDKLKKIQKEIIQSLSQPKYPIAFELELDVLETKDLGNGYSEFMKPLKKRWIGKYIY